MNEPFFRIVPVNDKDYNYLVSKATGTGLTQRLSSNKKFVVLEMRKEDLNDDIMQKIPKGDHKKTKALMKTPPWISKNPL